MPLWAVRRCKRPVAAAAAASATFPVGLPLLAQVTLAANHGRRVLSAARHPSPQSTDHLHLAVVVGKDAVPRATVGNMGRLVDEMVTALARCKQPKLKVHEGAVAWGGGAQHEMPGR